jgi:hypothetical protein
MVGKRTYLIGTIVSLIGLVVSQDSLTRMMLIGIASFLALGYTFNKDRE